MYFNGFGVEKDSLIAKEWIEKAAKSGLPDSQFILGQFYRYGEGGIQSYEISFLSSHDKKINNKRKNIVVRFLFII